MKRIFRRFFSKDTEPKEKLPGVERRKAARTSVSSVLAKNPSRFGPTRPKPESQPEPNTLEKDSAKPSLSLDESSPSGNDPYNTGTQKHPDVWRTVRKPEEED